MDLNTLLNLISGVGFPMAISIYMIMWKKKDDEKTQEILQNFSLNIQENTILLKQINDKLEIDSKNKTRGINPWLNKTLLMALYQL